jgi:hypothetical protein
MRRSDGGRCELCKHWDHYCPATRDGAKPCRAGASVRTAESSCPDRFEPAEETWRCEGCGKWQHPDHGCADELPELCDTCWGEAERERFMAAGGYNGE